MEIEMKYGIAQLKDAEQIWDDEYLLQIGDHQSRETVYMKAAYFDTEDHVLLKHDIAFRVRMEGSRIVASLKWNGNIGDGLHTREEINVPVADDTCFIRPSADIFKESEQGQALMELVGEKDLHSLVETRFLRRKMRVDTGKTICEVAVDTGDIITDFGNCPICELEIELFSGDQEDVMQIGKVFATRYGLSVEDKSKYARGLEILRAGLRAKKSAQQ